MDPKNTVDDWLTIDSTTPEQADSILSHHESETGPRG